MSAKWYLVDDGATRMSIHPDYEGRPGGGVVTIGSTGLTFRPHRTGGHRGETMRYRPFSADDRLKAQLLAAAPELLAALVLCRSCLNEEIIAAGDLDHPTIRAHAKAAEQADAAIAKAEGRS
jgi:hypothetical protein